MTKDVQTHSTTIELSAVDEDGGSGNVCIIRSASGAQTIGIGRVDIQVGQYKTIPIRLNKSVAPDRHGLVHLVDVDLSGTPKALGGLPVGGGISIDLAREISKTKVHVTLPIAFTLGDGKPAQGAVDRP